MCSGSGDGRPRPAFDDRGDTQVSVANESSSWYSYRQSLQLLGAPMCLWVLRTVLVAIWICLSVGARAASYETTVTLSSPVGASNVEQIVFFFSTAISFIWAG